VRARLHRGRLAGILTALAGADAIVFGRRVFLGALAGASVFSGGAEAAPFLAHELAHVRQYRRLGSAAFLGRYIGEYAGRRLRGARHTAAYHAISFEREAEDELAAVREGDRAGELPA
jgi:hypothetical protein